MKVYAIAAGDPSLCASELGALFETYGVEARLESRGKLVLGEAGSLPGPAVGRAAYAREVGLLLSLQGDADAGSLPFGGLAGRRFKVDAQGFPDEEKKSIDAAVGRKVLEEAPGSRVSLREPEVVVRVLRSGREVLFGTAAPGRRRRWVDRRPRARAYFHPVAVFPKLARLLVNLARVKQGDVFMDPFAGTGSLLIEASEMGIEALGIDVQRKMVFGARANTQGGCHLVRADSRRMPIRAVGGMATDIPYGRASGIVGGAEEIGGRLLEQAQDLLRPGSHVVVMSSSGLVPAGAGGLALVSRHRLYVHRSLERAISVFRRR
ncbi:MAG: hypothetical protein JRN39_03370 [Nitrososphaerota archaeon]|nr:hypothetical protein [Nitrososphaerota archaeon]MDG6939423.1 hypothetical protein [Nitrososphaerota archaeon]